MEKIGQYTTLKKLGSGGFGEVWLGQSDLRQVAIKIFKPKADNLSSFVDHSGSDTDALQSLRQRFSQEAKILADLESNPHIISVYEFGELDDGSPYYVMPYLPLSLADKLGRDIYDAAALAELDEASKPKNLPLADALRYIEQLLTGLAAAHEQGLIHRDIKPSNVMLTEDDQVRLVDFGIAKTPDSQHSVSQVGMGSAKYMAPEQRESAKHVDARADVYSVGVMAYRMITGRLPGMPFREPNVFAQELGQGVNDLIVSCLADDKAQRPTNAVNLLAQYRACEQTQSDENATGTWVGDSGQSSIRDELKPLKADIRSALEDHVELTQQDLSGFSMAAAVLDLADSELPELIELVENELGQTLKQKRNFLRLLDQKLTEAKLDDDTFEQLVKTAATVGWDKTKVSELIEQRQPANQVPTESDQATESTNDEATSQASANASDTESSIEANTSVEAATNPPVTDSSHDQDNPASRSWFIWLALLVGLIAAAAFGYVWYEDYEAKRQQEISEINSNLDAMDNAAWADAQVSDSIQGYEYYLGLNFQQAESLARRLQAQTRIQELKGAAAKASELAEEAAKRDAKAKVEQQRREQAAAEQKQLDQREAERVAAQRKAQEQAEAEQEAKQQAKRKDDLAWQQAKTTNTVLAFDQYIASDRATLERMEEAERLKFALIEAQAEQRAKLEAEAAEKEKLNYRPIVAMQPQYPRQALNNNLRGWVLLEFDVTNFGTVSDPRVIENCASPKISADACANSPNSIFDQAATKTAYKFRYAPKQQNGAAVITKGVRYKVMFNF